MIFQILTRNKRLLTHATLLVLAAIALLILGQPTSNAISAGPMTVLATVALPGSGGVSAIVASHDESTVYASRGNDIYEIDTSTNTVVGSVALTLGASQTIADLEVSPDDTKLYSIATSGAASRLTVLDTATLSVIFTDDVSNQFLHWIQSPDLDSSIYIVGGGSGWRIFDSATNALIFNKLQSDVATQGDASDDGTRVYGQKSNTVSGDRALGWDAQSGASLGSFGIGDAGGEIFYTTTSGDDRILVLVGDSSISQNAYILDADTLAHIQTLGVSGLTWATEGADGQSVIVSQNRNASGGGANSGLTLVRYDKDAGSGWNLSEKLNLRSGSGIFAGQLTTTPSLNRYYALDRLGHKVFVVADGPQNQPPSCATVGASPAILWPPNHKFVEISIQGVTDPDGDAVTINVDGITQDEPVLDGGSGNTAPDGIGVDTSTASVRAERASDKRVGGNGRVYEITFTASDPSGASCSGSVQVAIPHDRGKNASPAVDDGQLFDSTNGS